VYPRLLGGGFGTRADYPLASTALDVTIADMNGDGIGDVLAPMASGASGSLAVLPGQSAGGLGAATAYGNLSFPWRVFVGRFNADAYPDVAVFKSGPAFAVFFGQAGGSLGAPTSVPLFFSGEAGRRWATWTAMA